VPSSKVSEQSFVQSSDELDNRGRFCLQQAFHDQLATSIHHGDRDGGVVHVHADILFLIHKGAPLRQVGDANNLNLLQK
jgi:hypothetical protein